MFPYLVEAQEEIAYFQDFTVEDGLSSTNAMQFYQDSRGIIWIGTSYGLNSYDGIAFRSYTKEDDGLCHNYIHAIAEDGKGNLWIQAGDYGRIEFCYSIFNPITEKAYTIEEYTGEPCPFNPNRTALNPTYRETFLLKEVQEGNRLQFYEVKEDKIEKGFSCIYKDTFHNLDYIVNQFPHNTIKLDEENYLFEAIKESNEKDLLALFYLNASGEITNKYSSEFSDLETTGVFRTDRQHYYHVKLRSNHHNILGETAMLSLYKDGELVGKTDYVFDGLAFPLLVKENIYKFYPNRIEKYKPLSDSLIYLQGFSLQKKLNIPITNFVDNGGNIWYYGTNEITKLSFRPNNFKLNLNNKIGASLARPIRGIVSRADGTVFAGELLGLNVRAPDIKDAGFNPIPIRSKKQDGFLGLLHDNDRIWIGKETYGLALYDVKTKEYSRYGKGLVWQPYKAPDGTIWAGAGAGLFKFDSLQKELIPFRNYGKYEQLGNSSIYAFYLNDRGTWLSTSSGMYLVDLAEEEILAHYSDTQKDEFYIPANHIAHIHEDEKGLFWLASKGQGLIRWNPATGKSEQLTKKNTGLSHNVLYAVYEDDFGNLWLPSDYGLNCLNKESRQVSLYFKDEGLPHNEFNTISHHQDKHGNLYFGTIDGMIEFHPKDFNHQSENIPFIISAASRIEQKTDSIINITHSVLNNHALTLKPSDKAAEVSFALLNYKKTKGNQYSYKIEGYQDRWIFQKNANVRLSGLPYGDYQLLFRGKVSGSSTWLEYSRPIQIQVTKPFYLQWWFLGSCLLALVLGVNFIIKSNARELLKRQEELEEIVEERTEEVRLQAEELKQLDKVKSNFFANISHELRTPLTLILGPLSYILDNPEEWEKESIQRQLQVMQRNGKSLMELIEEILDLSKLEANKLELVEEATPVKQFFERLFYVFEPQFQSQGLDYEMNLAIHPALHILLDRKKLEKILNNFLSNAIKFTPKGGKITLEVSETNDQLKIQVKDSGKGIHPKDLPHIFERFYQSKQADQKLYGGTGIGLALVNEFAQLMNGKAYAESKLGEGSKFFFEIPKKEVASQIILTQAEAELLVEEEIYAIGSDFTILIAEDNADMREFLHQLLQKKYKRILLAKNGAEGLALLKEHGTDIHLIVSDVMMPEVDGLTMLKEIKHHPEWAGIPVVMLTALAAERDKLTALTIGVDDYLTKPFSVPELLIRVQNLLFNYHQRLKWKSSPEFQEEKIETPEKNAHQLEIKIRDKEWIDELTKHVEESFGKVILDVESLAASVYLSSRQMNRKLKAITGLSPGKFIKEVQLQTARKILENGAFISISEVAYQVGFENPSNFSRAFKSRFGKSPSAYQ